MPVGVGRRDAMGHRVSRADDTGVPVQHSPAEGARLLDAAIQYCWSSTEDGFGYELQWAQRADFADATSVVMQNLQPATRHTHLPELPLRSGRWFWRVRTMTNEGTFGHWSPVRSFTTVTTRRKQDRALEISAGHPLFILYCGGEIVASWRSLPADLQPYIVLRVERHTAEDYLPLCEVAQRNGIPVLLQVVGPHDAYSGQYARIPLSDVEQLYQRFPAVKGVQIVEQSCQGGLRQPRVLRYLIGAIRLSAAYGRMVAWADGNWHGNNIWIDAGLHEELYRTMSECGEYIVPMWKMNCGWMPYAVQGAVCGFWLGGAVANWGVEPESWFWYEAGFRELGVQHGFKEGDVRQCPSTFWGQMALLGVSGGATVYCFEPPDAIWSEPGKLSPTWQRVLSPLLSVLVEENLIPPRELVQRMTRIAYVAGDADAPWREDGGPLRVLYEGTYGVEHSFEMIPGTGRYGWIPILSPLTPEDRLEGFAAVVHAGSFATAAEAGTYFAAEYPTVGEGEAWAMKLDTLGMAMHHRENRDGAEKFALPLDGAFRRLEGELEVNSYLLVRQEGPGRLRLHLNGRADRRTRLRLARSCPGPAQVEATPEAALTVDGDQWVVDFRHGAVELVVRR